MPDATPTRTPMPWRDVDGGGFTDPGVRPWLPFGDLGAGTVEAQRGDPDSMLTFTRDLIALRHASPDLQTGDYRTLAASDDTWAWSRGRSTVVVANMSDGEGRVDGVSGRVLLGTDRRRDGSSFSGSLKLQGWEAVVVERSEADRSEA